MLVLEQHSITFGQSCALVYFLESHRSPVDPARAQKYFFLHLTVLSPAAADAQGVKSNTFARFGIHFLVFLVHSVNLKWWHEVLLGPPLPHAPGARMT